MAKKILVADLLCGAGGSSTGAARALADLGLEMDLVCVNHWPVAIDTHRRNHPQARHYVQDISTVRPHLLVPEGYLDLLMASPTCTHHSVARGGKPTSDQQRSDPWHIVTWLTELRVKRIIIENVWEFIGWGPVDRRTGRPVKSRKGEYFNAWIDTLRRLGFELEWRKLNAADYGDATTRQRFILMGRSDGRKVRWPQPTHRRRDDLGADLFAMDAKPWRPAREIIDWSIRGKSIFGRKKPLADKTLARIHAGAVKFGWPEPFLVILRQHMAGLSVGEPLPTIAANGNHIGLAQFSSPLEGEDGETPAGTAGRLVDPGEGCLAEPVVVNMKGRSTASGVADPLPTQTSHAAHLFTAEPVIMNGRKGNQALPVSEAPVPTLDTKGGVWLAEPLVLSQHNSGAARTGADPLPTITTGGAGVETRPGCARPMLVEPFVLSRHAEGAPRSVDDPVPTQVAKHSHLLVTSYYGMSAAAGSGDDPLPTVTTKDRFGIVVPVTHSQGGNAARDTASPLPTLTTAKGGEFAIVMPVTHQGGVDRSRDAAEPLPTITGAYRGELAFITAQHGERPGQSPRVHDLDNPAPTIAASGHVDLVEPDLSGQEAGSAEGATGTERRYDILFRMLEPHELAAAMGFNTDEATYEFAGTKTEKIKQIGNAVSVAKMKACVGAIMADAAPKARAAVEPEYREAAE